VKLHENTFRAVNIALANETSLMCDRLGIDVWEVIDAAASKPFGFMPFYPGPGIGGHCIPLDPHYLSWKMRTLNYRARFIELASEINSAMPEHVVGKVATVLNEREKSIKGANILVLGVAYKPDIDDARESPALDIIGLLGAKGAEVAYHDPYVGAVRMPGGVLRSVELTADVLGAADCVVVATNHRAIDWALVDAHARVLVDTRRSVRHPEVE
jgi:UDP-N-acetyl-D-glucosamine dehydrogenase